MPKRIYLVFNDETLDEAHECTSKAAAIAEYRDVARELANIGNAPIGATLHYAASRAEIVEDPDFQLDADWLGRVRVTRC